METEMVKKAAFYFGNVYIFYVPKWAEYIAKDKSGGIFAYSHSALYTVQAGRWYPRLCDETLFQHIGYIENLNHSSVLKQIEPSKSLRKLRVL